jgi:hypothetical protein
VNDFAVDRPTTVVPDLAGEPYTAVLRRVHDVLAPRTYFEVGCNTGASLAYARGRVIGVDPSFAVMGNAFAGKSACHFFQMTSDAFFRDHDPQAILGAPIDLAFLDGMHLYEFALRDFMNTERSCRKNSIIMLHDCLPVDATITTREDDVELRRQVSTKPTWWTGDVWKLMVILQRYRPDLTIVVLDAAPTGLVMVTNLNPDSRVLGDSYAQICAEFGDIQLQDYGIERYFSEIAPRSTLNYLSPVDFARQFWL